MNVKEAMSSPVATCRPETTLAAAGLRMLRQDCGVLPVVDDVNGLIGIITDRDICVAVSTRTQHAHALPVETAMATRLHTVGPDDTLLHALDVMRHGRVHRLPVLDADSNLVGLISINDIVLLTGAAEVRTTGPGVEEVMAALREIRAHWRPRINDDVSVHPIVPSERHTSTSLAPVMAPDRAPVATEYREEPELEPIEHTSDFDWEE